MAGGANAPEVAYLSSSNAQYQVVPVSMAVYIDQNSINNLLIELANSPMSIRVIDYEQQRPATRIKKPEKGESLPNSSGGGMMGGGGAYASMGSMMMRGGADLFNSMGAGGYGGGGGAFPGSAAYGQRRGGGSMEFDRGGSYAPSGSGGGARAAEHGKDLRDRTPEKIAEEKKKAREAVEVKIHDPYYNIVEVRIYGQARFYNVPPAEKPVETTSPGDTPAAEPAKDQTAPAAADAAKTEAPAKGDEAKDAKAEETKDKAREEPKDARPAAEPKDSPQAGDKAKAEETKSGPEASKPKTEAPKAEAAPAKQEAPKADPGSDAPKR
jgi:hypothetical protein